MWFLQKTASQSLVVLSILASQIGMSLAFGFSAKPKSHAPSNAFENDEAHTELVDLIKLPDQAGNEVYTQALMLLQSLQGSPSCNREAAMGLLTSCRAIDGSSSSEATIEDVRSLYAANLAVCEIQDTGSAIPSLCSTIPASKRRRSHGFGDMWGRSSENTEEHRARHTAVDRRQLTECLKCLESKPQWWTSYSNNRQNAVVMCEAARTQIEKDALLELHKKMVETNSNVDMILSDALREARGKLARQHEFAVAVEAFQQKLLQDLAQTNVGAQSLIKKLGDSLDAMVQSSLYILNSGVSSLKTDVGKLSQHIRETAENATRIDRNIARIFQQVLKGTSELAAVQNKELDISNELVSQIQISLHQLENEDINALAVAFNNIHQQLQASQELVATMHFRQNTLDKRLAVLDESFEKLGSKADQLIALQVIFAENQTDLQEQMQNDLYLARGVLAEVTTSATQIHAMLENTSAQIANMASLSKITGTMLRWGWIFFVFFAFCLYSPRTAAYMTASLGAILLIKASLQHLDLDSLLTSYAPDLTLSFQTTTTTILATCAILAGICITILSLLYLFLSHTSTRWSTKLSDLKFTSPMTLWPTFESPRRHRTWHI